jgi:hypothetical protein
MELYPRTGVVITSYPELNHLHSPSRQAVQLYPKSRPTYQKREPSVRWLPFRRGYGALLDVTTLVGWDVVPLYTYRGGHRRFQFDAQTTLFQLQLHFHIVFSTTYGPKK